MTTPTTVGRRGRPAIVHDNVRVRAFLCRFASLIDLTEEVPELDDVLTGIAHLQTEGQCSSRPLSKRMLFRALQACDVISTDAIAGALGRDYSRATLGRYTAHARAASKAIERLLRLRPDWEAAAGGLRAARDELDAPFLLDVAFDLAD